MSGLCDRTMESLEAVDMKTVRYSVKLEWDQLPYAEVAQKLSDQN